MIKKYHPRFINILFAEQTLIVNLPMGGRSDNGKKKLWLVRKPDCQIERNEYFQQREIQYSSNTEAAVGRCSSK